MASVLTDWPRSPGGWKKKTGGWFTSGKPTTPGVEFMMSTQRQVSRGQEVVPSFVNGAF